MHLLIKNNFLIKDFRNFHKEKSAKMSLNYYFNKNKH